MLALAIGTIPVKTPILTMLSVKLLDLEVYFSYSTVQTATADTVLCRLSFADLGKGNGGAARQIHEKAQAVLGFHRFVFVGGVYAVISAKFFRIRI